MYNFADHKLLPKVSTKSAVMEKYEVNNLISDNFLVKARGFLSYTSIKPPVDVDFELICPIEIACIALSTVVGTQKTTGIEVLIKNNNSEFDSICRAFYNETGVVFCNSRFYSKQSISEHINKDFYLAFFKSNLFRLYTNADKIKIRILRTEKSVPCLSKVEIWGKVSKTCSKVTASTIHKLLHKKIDNPANNIPNNESNKQFTEFEVPEDFNDALTFEIMTIPMTLPSGHTIDQSTLEKCLSNDITYGRQGCDPFTGLEFTGTRKPILNAGLKTRIDMFLMQNAHRPETFKVHRTLGRSESEEYNQYLTKTSTCTNETLKIRRITQEAGHSYDLDEVMSVSKTMIDPNNVSQSCDLDQAIKNVLSCSNFVRFTKDVTEHQVIHKCSQCDCLENLYKIPCKHLYCKQCLLKICKELVCKVCLCMFQKSDPMKFHC